MRKPVKCGLDFVRGGADWQPMIRSRSGAEALGRKIMPSDLKALGFGVAVFEADDYFRISFGRKA